MAKAVSSSKKMAGADPETSALIGGVSNRTGPKKSMKKGTNGGRGK